MGDMSILHRRDQIILFMEESHVFRARKTFKQDALCLRVMDPVSVLARVNDAVFCTNLMLLTV